MIQNIDPESLLLLLKEKEKRLVPGYALNVHNIIFSVTFKIRDFFLNCKFHELFLLSRHAQRTVPFEGCKWHVFESAALRLSRCMLLYDRESLGRALRAVPSERNWYSKDKLDFVERLIAFVIVITCFRTFNRLWYRDNVLQRFVFRGVSPSLSWWNWICSGSLHSCHKGYDAVNSLCCRVGCLFAWH